MKENLPNKGQSAVDTGDCQDRDHEYCDKAADKAKVYSTQELAGAKRGATVYLVSAERTAARLAREGSEHGLIVLAGSDGAGGWQERHCECFRGFKVVVCGKNDEQGRKHAEEVAGSLDEVADSVKVIFPSDATGGNLDDWLDAGNSIDDFLREAEDAPRWQPPREYPEFACTDTGNAERLCELLKGKARWCKAFGWCCWDRTKWQLDQDEQMLYETKRIFRSLRAAAASVTGDGEKAKQLKDKLLSWAEKSESCQTRQRVLTLLKSEPAIRVHPEEFDQNRWLLNTENRMLDLSLLGNGRDPAVARVKDLMVTHMLPVEYDPDAECPRWERFVGEIFDGRKEIVEFVQKMAGYSMSGDTREQCVFILHGNGRNGKSTMLNVLDSILGPLSRSAAIETFCTGRGNKIPEDRAVLRDARMVKTSEVVDKQHTLDLGFIKDATGGENLSGRFLYKNTFEYAPQFKVWMACNVKPRIPNMDYGTWRRIRLIPFNVKFAGKEDNRNLKTELLAEKSGILNWMLEGCRKWQQEGLNPPDAIVAATEEYRNDADSMGDFFERRIETGEDFSEAAAALHSRYEQHCRDCNQTSVSSTAFGLSLAERGFTKKRRSEGVVWQGLRLTKN